MLNLINKNGEALLDKHWLGTEKSERLFHSCYESISWNEEIIFLFGKRIKCPRLTAFYGDKGVQYTYSGTTRISREWIAPLKELQMLLLADFNLSFNSVLCNLYRNGNDYMGWHSDNESEIYGETIASISLGATRKFQFRHKKDRALINLDLFSGSLLLMLGEIQQYWEHRLPKDTHIMHPRINLTFRKVNRGDSYV